MTGDLPDGIVDEKPKVRSYRLADVRAALGIRARLARRTTEEGDGWHSSATSTASDVAA